MNALAAALPLTAWMAVLTVTCLAGALWRRSWGLWLLGYASAVGTLLVAWP